MRTYITPIGYDTRRVTRPVIKQGLSDEDRLVLVRPEKETDTERAEQAVADVEQFLQEIEPNYELTVQRVVTDSFEDTVRECCELLDAVDPERKCILSLSGGARDVLLPLAVAALVLPGRVDAALFFSDIDNSVAEWKLPDLTASIPDRARETFAIIESSDDWCTITSIVEQTDQSRSTIIRHVNDLEAAGVVMSDSSERSKRVRSTFTGELLSFAA